jgi:hypothetical protein
MANNAESSEKQNFVGEKKKSHATTRQSAIFHAIESRLYFLIPETVYMLLVLDPGVAL